MIIDMCSGGVTKKTVQKMIDNAVFKSGTMTPELTQRMIDDSAEVIIVNRASAEKLIAAYNNPGKYIFYYEEDGMLYLGRTINTNHSLLWIYFDIVYFSVESRVQLAEDMIIEGTINRNGVFAVRRRDYKPYEYDLSYYDSKEQLKRIYDRAKASRFNFTVSWWDGVWCTGRYWKQDNDYVYIKGYGEDIDGNVVTSIIRIDSEGNI